MQAFDLTPQLLSARLPLFNQPFQKQIKRGNEVFYTGLDDVFDHKTC